ncbi:MAG: DUF1826 domain-containing protein [Actinobacteria bacterium]|nr:DUF1826 domain-containing protein [Actinomycetota bacterium]
MDSSEPDTVSHTPTVGGSRAESSARSVEDVAGLSALFEDDVNVVVLSRKLDSVIIGELQVALAQPSFRVLTSVTPSEGPGALMAQMTEFPRLAEEVHFWTEVLAELTGCELVGVRLARLEAAMCPRFHVDKVTVRVVSTFAGHGTEYLAEEDVDRRWLGHAARGVSDEASGLMRPGARIRRAEASDVVLLKGEAWPKNAGRGAVHRSPAASAASPRLVMTLDRP